MSVGHVKYIKDCGPTSGLCETLDLGAEKQHWPGISRAVSCQQSEQVNSVVSTLVDTWTLPAVGYEP